MLVVAVPCALAALAAPGTAREAPRPPAPGIRVTGGPQWSGPSGPGSPTTPFRVTATGFPHGHDVEVYFDRADLARGVTNGQGSFSIGLQVPGGAVPGTHWLTAVDGVSGQSAQQPFEVTTPWPQSRGGETQEGFNRFENVLDDTPGSGTNVAHLADRVRARTGSAILGAPVLDAAGTAYVALGARKVAAYPACVAPPCAPAWTFDAASPMAGPPAVAGARVFVASTDGTLAALPVACQSSCVPAWTADVGGPVRSSPTVAGGRVYVASSDGSVEAFAVGGCGHPTCPPAWTAHAGGPVVVSPTVGPEGVVVGRTDGFMVAFRSNGAVRWKRDVGGPVAGAPTLITETQADPALLVGTRHGFGGAPARVVSLTAATGAMNWTVALHADVTAPLAAAYGMAYAGAADGRVYAMRTWGCRSPCAPVWNRVVGRSAVGPPAVANGLMYAASKAGVLRVFNALNGRLALWTDLPGTSAAAPVVTDGTVTIGLDDGTLHRFALPSPPQPPSRPTPGSLQPFATPIRHVVVLFQENQSFDSMLGSLCQVDSRCDGASSGRIDTGETVPLVQGTDVVPNVIHNPQSQTAAINGGQMNGFSLIPGCGEAGGYACYQQYRPWQIPNLARLARSFALSDRTFESDAGASWGAHFILAATTLDGFRNFIPRANPRLPGPTTWGCNSFDTVRWVPPGGGSGVTAPSCVPKPDGSGPFRDSPVPWVPTIMDRLDGAGLTWRIYSTPDLWSVCPTFADCVFDPQVNALVPTPQVKTDAHNGLPTLSLVMPTWIDSQHNGAPIANGDNWIGSVVQAIESGPDWDSTAIFITYDDCGCFYDHVPPPDGLGIREPLVIVSPWARAGFTDSAVASFDSMLAFTERTFGLDPLTSADAGAYDFADSFDFSQAPIQPVPLRRHRVPPAALRWARAHPQESET